MVYTSLRIMGYKVNNLKSNIYNFIMLIFNNKNQIIMKSNIAFKKNVARSFVQTMITFSLVISSSEAKTLPQSETNNPRDQETLDARIPQSSRYEVTINGKPVTVYETHVRAELLPQQDGLTTHREGYNHEVASYTMFDVASEVTVSVTVKDGVHGVRILPESSGIVPKVSRNKVTFKMSAPAKLTLLCDESDAHVLHIWGGEPQMQTRTETGSAKRYFAPGYHEIEPMELASGETLEVAEGAYLKIKKRTGDHGVYSERWKVDFLRGAVFNVKDAENVRICGRGIIDMVDIPHPGYTGILLNNARRVRIEGVTLVNAAGWNINLQLSEDVEVRDVRIISARLNSDGVNTLNSRNVRIEECFVRNCDDSFVVKSANPDVPVHNVMVSRCTVWNDWGYALGITYETRSTISHVTFKDNAVIYSSNWMLGIYLSDEALVQDIHFENNTLSALPERPSDTRELMTKQRKLIKFHIIKDMWSQSAMCGRIQNVTVDGLHIHGTTIPPGEILGCDKEHNIQNVRFSNITLNGIPVRTLEELGLKMNDFADDVILDFRLEDFH